MRELALLALPGPQCPSLAEAARVADSPLTFWKARAEALRGPGRLPVLVSENGTRAGFLAAYVDGEEHDRCVIVQHMLLTEQASERAVTALLTRLEGFAIENAVPEIVVEVCCGHDRLTSHLAERGYRRGPVRPASHRSVQDGVARISAAVEWTLSITSAMVMEHYTAAHVAS